MELYVWNLTFIEIKIKNIFYILNVYSVGKIMISKMQKNYYLDSWDRKKYYYSENYNKRIARKKLCSNNRYKTVINFR